MKIRISKKFRPLSFRVPIYANPISTPHCKSRNDNQKAEWYREQHKITGKRKFDQITYNEATADNAVSRDLRGDDWVPDNIYVRRMALEGVTRAQALRDFAAKVQAGQATMGENGGAEIGFAFAVTFLAPTKAGAGNFTACENPVCESPFSFPWSGYVARRCVARLGLPGLQAGDGARAIIWPHQHAEPGLERHL